MYWSSFIPDVSVTISGLWYYTVWVQWWHSLHTYPSAAFCIHTNESHLPFTPVLTTRNIRALSLPRHRCRIYIAETQTCLQALSLLRGSITIHSESISSDSTKIYFESRILRIWPTSERERRRLSQKFCNGVVEKMPWWMYFPAEETGNFFSIKKPKGQMN